eukprot:scaffold1795_cov140-Isochrysis_galbana.AAC.2
MQVLRGQRTSSASRPGGTRRGDAAGAAPWFEWSGHGEGERTQAAVLRAAVARAMCDQKCTERNGAVELLAAVEPRLDAAGACGRPARNGRVLPEQRRLTEERRHGRKCRSGFVRSALFRLRCRAA